MPTFMNNGKSMSWEQMHSILEAQGTGMHQSERVYRRGYWDGYYSCVQHYQETQDPRQLEEFCNNELWDWNHGDCKEIQEPPQPTMWQELRKQAFKRLGTSCVYCGRPAEQIDHLFPVSKGGSYDIRNLVPACKKCNLRKHNKTFSEFISGEKRHSDRDESNAIASFWSYWKFESERRQWSAEWTRIDNLQVEYLSKLTDDEHQKLAMALHKFAIENRDRLSNYSQEKEKIIVELFPDYPRRYNK